MKTLLIEKINKSDWWHVPPQDPLAYKKRGKFLASTFLQAEFYGRPNDEPETVNIQNPIFGFSELEILQNLFGDDGEKYLSNLGDEESSYEKRIALDAKMHRKAKELGFDAIVLMVESGKRFLQQGVKPHSIELNLVL